MIHYIVACKDTTTLDQFLHPSFEKYRSPESLMYIEEGEDRTIFKKYNDALSRIPKIEDNDVVVFSHDDITIKDEYFEDKLDLYFKIRTKVGIAGVIGTNIFEEGSGWWLTDRQTNTRGRIVQGFKDGSEHTMAEPSGSDDSQIVSVDGCVLFMRGIVAQTFRFDEDTYTGYHFYDVDTCFTLLEQGWDVGIIDVLVKHESEGPLTQSWYDNRVNFMNKWMKKGYRFPIVKNSIFKKKNG